MARRIRYTRRNRHRRSGSWKRFWLVLVAVPAFYLLAALIGSLILVNTGWHEPGKELEATTAQTVYLVSNGVHTDLILPAAAQGLDWGPMLPGRDFADRNPRAQWIAFGMGERRVYLDTPHWADIRPRTVWAGLTGGERVMHVEWVVDPTWNARAIRLRPEEYRRLWSAVHASFRLDEEPNTFIRIDHPGYGPDDAFYRGVGRASAVNTCNVWAADMLRIAGVKTSLWSPFAQGLEWRYRKAG